MTARVISLKQWRLARAATRTEDDGRSRMPLEFCRRVAENARREVLRLELASPKVRPMGLPSQRRGPIPPVK